MYVARINSQAMCKAVRYTLTVDSVVLLARQLCSRCDRAHSLRQRFANGRVSRGAGSAGVCRVRQTRCFFVATLYRPSLPPP
jgi:hypothetical protein